MDAILSLIFYLVIWGLIFYVLWWGLGRISLPEPFAKIATVLLVVLAVVVLLNMLWGFAGSVPRLTWK